MHYLSQFINFFLINFFICFVKSNEPNNYCVDLDPQHSVDIKQLMGMWYGVEIIYHHNRGGLPPSSKSRGCPVIFLRGATESDNVGYDDYNPNGYDNNGYNNEYNYNYEKTPVLRNLGYNRRQDDVRYDTTTDQYYNSDRAYNNKYNSHYRPNWRNISLLWDEEVFSVEYNLRYERRRPGFWISSGARNGSETSFTEMRFNTFSGNIQVLKAVGTHLILTFCHTTPNYELFSIILSRGTSLDHQEIGTVHNLLMRKRLKTSHVRKVCRNSADTYRTFTQLVYFVIAWCLYKSH